MLLNMSGKSNSYKTNTNEKRRTNSYFLFNKRQLLVKFNDVSDVLKRPPRESFAAGQVKTPWFPFEHFLKFGRV